MRKVLKICLFLSLSVAMLGTSMTVFAYDLSADHNVNQTIDFDATRKKVWDVVRGEGFSEEATAGIVGNIGLESGGFNYTVTQGHSPWSSFTLGQTGIGLAQWTSQGRQMTLFSIADDRGTQWTDLDTQLQCLLLEMNDSNWWGYNNTYTSLDDFKARCKDIDEACIIFMRGFERPNELYAHLDLRKTYSYDAFNLLNGSKLVYSINGGSQNTNSSSSIKVSSMIDEWDLTGMPQKSNLQSSSKKIFLLSNDSLSAGEKYSIEKIKERVSSESKYTLLEYLRIGLVFIGLTLLLYAVLLLTGYIFDKGNTIVAINLLGLVSFGRLRYYEEQENLKDRTYINGKRMLIIYFVVSAIGLALVTGSLFKWVVLLLSKIRGFM